MIQRLLIVLAVLVTEGLGSLVLGRPFVLPLLVGGPAHPGLTRATDEERMVAARLSLGAWRTHVDPLLSYVIKPGLVSSPDQQPFVANMLGLRGLEQKLTDEPAFRVVVLGDSVAFGMGVKDDETLAAQLQLLLQGLWPADAAPLQVLTAAASGWNHVNALRFLIDHGAELRPDVVVYLPVDNDLANAFGVSEAGHRRQAPDLSQPEPLLDVSLESPLAVLQHIEQRARSGGVPVPPREELGPFSLLADIGAESRRRFDENVDTLERMAELCERLGAHLLVTFFVDAYPRPSYGYGLRERILDRGLRLRTQVLFGQRPPEVSLSARDAHPSPLGHRMMAAWVADELVQTGWIQLAPGAALPRLPPEWDALRAAPRSHEDLSALAAALRGQASALLRSRVDLRTGEGAAQIYGGLNPDGNLGPRLLAMLAAAGPRLRVVLGDTGESPYLMPLQVTVTVDGEVLGNIAVPPRSAEPAVLVEFALPRPPLPGAVLEVLLSADEYVVTRFQGRSQLTSCRLHLLESF